MTGSRRLPQVAALVVTAVVLWLPANRAAGGIPGGQPAGVALGSSPAPASDQAAVCTQPDVELGLGTLLGPGRIVARAATAPRWAHPGASCLLRAAAGGHPGLFAALNRVRPRSPPGAPPT